jgi:hypothetical protein
VAERIFHFLCCVLFKQPPKPQMVIKIINHKIVNRVIAVKVSVLTNELTVKKIYKFNVYSGGD